MKNFLVTLAVVFIAAFLGGLVAGLVGNQSVFGATGTRFQNGVSADSTSPVAGEIRSTTLTVTSTGTLTGVQTFSAAPVFNGGQLRSYTNSTSTTATTYTLVQADILNYDTMLLTPNKGDLTLTLPASSTLTSLAPSAGDVQKICIVNASSTAGIDITLAAGPGIDLGTVATSTVPGIGIYPIGPEDVGCIEFIRRADTDLNALFTVFGDAD